MDFLNEILKTALGSNSSIVSTQSVAGGSINRVQRLDLKCGTRVLAKLSGSDGVGFGHEVDGLSAIVETQTFRTPNLIATGESPQPYLMMEWIESTGTESDFWQRFGHQLAAMHDVAGSKDGFGFATDNVIGAKPQINAWAESWTDFFCQRRLGYQFKSAREAGYFSDLEEKQFEVFLERVAELLDVVNVKPALIHGDLWSGNFLCDVNQNPVLIDPAVSYSHSEAEFSIMKMFGGFDQQLFDAYHEIRPPVAGWEDRVEIYSLYHYLNHLNLFGRSYLGDCRRIINQYL